MVRPYAVRRSDFEAEALACQWLGCQSQIAILSARTTLVLVEHAMTDAAAGDATRVRIDPADLHVFDPATGAAIGREKE